MAKADVNFFTGTVSNGLAFRVKGCALWQLKNVYLMSMDIFYV